MAAETANPPYQPPYLHPPTTFPAKKTVLVGRYQLGRILGRGSFSKVYHARSLNDNKPVAIKVIDKSKTNPSEYPRIVGVVSAMRRLDHPNVLKIHEVMSSKNKIYLVMELAKGGDLLGKLSRRTNRRFPERLAGQYFQQLVSALRYCHRNGVAHCDVNLQSILLDDEGNIKVRQKSDHVLRTARGTLAFTPPEIVGRSRGGYDGYKADAWSCGVILFVMLTGYLPFDDSNLVKMYRKMRQYEFQFPAWVSKPARGLITRLLDPNPKFRLSIDNIRKDGWFKYQGLVYPRSVWLVDMASLEKKKHKKAESGLKRKTSMNAFDIISMSSGFNLSGMFEMVYPRSVTLADLAPLEEKKHKMRGSGLEAKTSMNAFEIISMSSGLNLSEMFERVGGKGARRREKRGNGSGSSLESELGMSSCVWSRKGGFVLSLAVAAEVVGDGELGWEEEELYWGELKDGLG